VSTRIEVLRHHLGSSPPAASHRQWRCSTALGDARLGYSESGLREEPNGSGAPSKRSPEQAPAKLFAAAHGGRTTILSYGVLGDAENSSEDAYAHPEADASLAEVGDGRR
jgi:hypothetical protein